MKTGIITYHFVNNFGGALQAYALRRVIVGHFCEDAELIDYRHWFIRATDAIRMLPVTPDIKYYRPWLRSFGAIRRRRKKFASFIQGCKRSRRCDWPFQLKGIRGDYRALICGSDQIWNPALTFGIAKPYFLTFAEPGCRRISYAASVGSVDGRGREKMLSYIRNLDAVSIREGVEWIENAPGLSVERHIDPTLLLTPGEWDAVAKAPETEGKYILVYIMQQNSDAYGIIGKIKARLGYRVIDISRYGYQPECVDQSLVDLGPEEFVGLFRGASHVCTNSFHGLIFALIFHKSVDFIPMRRFGGRVEYLCSLLHMNMVPVDDGAYYRVEYDSSEMEAILERERQRALSYLKRELEMADDQN